MSVIVRTVEQTDVTHDEGIIAQPDEQNNLIVWGDGDKRIATYHRDQWVSATIAELPVIVKTPVSPSDTKINRLAQTFYEASGISLPSMADKLMIVRGLQAVFAQLRAETSS